MRAGDEEAMARSQAPGAATPPPGMDGSAVELRELLTRHLPQLEAMVRQSFGRTLRTQESAADLLHSVCGDLLHRDVPFEYRGEQQFLNWLRSVVTNKIRARLRAAGTQKRDVSRRVEAQPSELAAFAICDGSPERDAALHEDLGRLDAALAKLPEHYREVIVRTRLLGESQATVAAAMGRTVASTRNLLSRALVTLARIMDRDGPTTS